MGRLLKQDNDDESKAVNLVTGQFLSNLEAITSKSRNLAVVLTVAKILDIVLSSRWYEFKQNDTWTSIYLVNYIFDLHDIFHGSFLS
jgi:hypothetical protein